jgi:hypothetical protein
VNPRRPYRISKEDREARASRMRARNADPEFQNKTKHGKQGWTEDTRAAQAARLDALRADPGFVARQRAARAVAKPRPIRVPRDTAPVVRGLFVGMNLHLATFGDVSTRSGVSYDTLRRWRQHMPHVDLLEAALNTLDFELAIVPIGSRDDDGFLRPRKGRPPSSL